MILLKELKLNNFLSHENTKISFEENEKLLLDGRSGSGKSTITEAILWTLYGKGRSENRSLVRRSTKSATCSLKLSDGQSQYVITRSVSSAGKNSLIITQNKGSKGQFLPIERVGLKDNQDWIEKEFLKASYELFTNSVAYPQENENSFVKATASRRKDLLLEIVRAGNFDELYDKARRTINEKEIDNTVLVTKVDGFETVIKNAGEIAGKYESCQKTNDEMTAQIESFSLLEKSLDAQLNNVSQLGKQITDKKVIRQMLVNSISSINTELENLQKAVKEHKEFDIQSAKTGVVEAIELTKEIERLENELKDNAITQQRINAHLSNKPSVFDYTKDIEIINTRLIPLIKDTGKCPAGDNCPFVVPIQGQIDFLTQQITEKTEKSEVEKELLKRWENEFSLLPVVKDTTETYRKMKELRDKIEVLSRAKTIISEYETFENNLGEMNVKEIALKVDRDEKFGTITTTENQIADLEKTLLTSDSNKINSDLASVRTSKRQLQALKEEASVGMAMALKAKESIQIATDGLITLKKDIVKVQEDKEALELLKEALSPRGIKAVVIDYLVPQLEDRINGVLAQMSDFRIRLDTQKATVDEEGVKEGLFITVINDLKEELPFQSYSGGEKVKITVAISEALASLMSQIGFRIMDENIISLDRESTEGFVTVLTKLQEKFPQLLVISHLQEVKDIFEKSIMIIKINGISQIK